LGIIGGLMGAGGSPVVGGAQVGPSNAEPVRPPTPPSNCCMTTTVNSSPISIIFSSKI